MSIPQHEKISKDDEGPTAFVMITDTKKKVIILQFSKPITWAGFDAKAATRLKNALEERIKDIL